MAPDCGSGGGPRRFAGEVFGVAAPEVANLEVSLVLLVDLVVVPAWLWMVI